MKIWAEYCQPWEECPKMGVDWYRHSKAHPYKGVTVHFIFFKWMVIVTWVNDYKLYSDYYNKRSEKMKKYLDKFKKKDI